MYNNGTVPGLMTLDSRWTRTMDDGFKEPSCHQWDLSVSSEIADYNNRLSTTTGYVSVDWKLILSMLWVESGGPKNAAWQGRVMQIGNAGDPGYDALKKREGATTLIARSELLATIDEANAAAINAPLFNIQCGIAYLFTRMARSDTGTILDSSDTAVHEHTVQQGETATSIAQQEQTTLDEIRASSPDVNIDRLRIGDVLRFRRARRGRTITGWRAFTPEVIAERYNVGDPSYADKLRYVLDKLNAE